MIDYGELIAKTYFTRMRARREPVTFANKDRMDGLKVMFKTGVVGDLD